jgi:hypothetical protein
MRWRRRVKVQVASILTIDQAAGLANAWYARKLAPDWRRHTPDEAEALFARLGLEREFWRVR